MGNWPRARRLVSAPGTAARELEIIFVSRLIVCVVNIAINFVVADLNFQYVLDTKKIGSPRMAFFDRGTHTFNETVTLQKDAPEICKTERIYIKNEIRDKLTALESELRYSLADQPIEQRRDPNSNLMPTLDLNLPPVRKDSITVQKNCGPDKTCIPNLHVDVKK